MPTPFIIYSIETITANEKTTGSISDYKLSTKYKKTDHQIGYDSDYDNQNDYDNQSDYDNRGDYNNDGNYGNHSNSDYYDYYYGATTRIDNQSYKDVSTVGMG